MRNKTAFVNDAKKVLESGFLNDEQLVEDAAHSMNHTGLLTYTIPGGLTTTDKDETFKFEKKLRQATDGTNRQVEDYFYVERGE